MAVVAEAENFSLIGEGDGMGSSAGDLGDVRFLRRRRDGQTDSNRLDERGQRAVVVSVEDVVSLRKVKEKSIYAREAIEGFFYTYLPASVDPCPHQVPAVLVAPGGKDGEAVAARQITDTYFLDVAAANLQDQNSFCQSSDFLLL